MFEEFEESMVEAAGLRLLVRRGGTGPVVLLLHGHPRTSSTWHRVAPQLVERGHTVVCVDLPGYGRSDKPTPAADHRPHSKRAGAHRLLAAMRNLGHDQFDVVGHDRGSYNALRLALDHPQAVRRAVLLDCLPISEHLDRADAQFATAWWHWFFFAQPDIPERVILADPDAWYHGDPTSMGEANYAEWRTAMRDPHVVRGMLEDYRAGLTVDYADETADALPADASPNHSWCCGPPSTTSYSSTATRWPSGAPGPTTSPGTAFTRPTTSPNTPPTSWLTCLPRS